MTHHRAEGPSLSPSPFLRVSAAPREKKDVRAEAQRRREEGATNFAVLQALIRASFPVMRSPLPRLLLAAAPRNHRIFFAPGGMKLMKLPAPQAGIGAS